MGRKRSSPEQPWSSVQFAAAVGIVVGDPLVVTVVAIVPVDVIEPAIVVWLRIVPVVVIVVPLLVNISVDSTGTLVTVVVTRVVS